MVWTFLMNICEHMLHRYIISSISHSSVYILVLFGEKPEADIFILVLDTIYFILVHVEVHSF